MTEQRTARQHAIDLYEEAGVGPALGSTYADALLALRDTETAANLRAAGFERAAALIQPDPDLIDAAWGEDQ
ncbi:hypothetical protein [Streptomyces sp. NPDC058735]|uniref:hypothetical protein n=1 Tax=unclassified Streptomyces TaxID=2593676 RepID=UPI0036A320A1